jgi:hypothetical protein
MKILSANHGDFNKYINLTRSENTEKNDFTFEEYKQWLIEKEKERQGIRSNLKAKESSEKLVTINSYKNQNWFGSSSEKAFLLNRYEGHLWSKFFLRCTFLDDYNFCSSSEDGFLCVWNLYQSNPIQKQKISNFVLNDVAVWKNNRINGSLNEIGEKDNSNGNGELRLVGENGENKMIVVVGCDDPCVKIL